MRVPDKGYQRWSCQAGGTEEDPEKMNGCREGGCEESMRSSGGEK